MSEPRDFVKKLQAGRNWLLGLAIALTVVWLLGGLAYILQLGGWIAVLNLGTADIGGFLEGFFAPLAFLWLVIGLFVQQRELASNTEALKHTNLISERQTNVLEATELRARQATFFQIAEHVRKQTANLAGLILQRLVTEQGEHIYAVDEINENWADHLRGDSERFTALLAQPDPRIVAAGLSRYEIFYKNPESMNYTTEFIRSYRALLTHAQECDTDGTIERTVTQSTHGEVYAMMLDAIVPPACWALLDPFTLDEFEQDDANFLGTWNITTQARGDRQAWRLSIERTADGFRGSLNSEDLTSELDGIVVAGALMFARIVFPGHAFIFTARVRASRISGSVDSRNGVFATFEGTRT
ncbi:MAG: hypothetical protein F4W90_12665 [Gammaproteobacteria bacterium]|nr:hypothetical protein [Gammaproteobacteria bacterium]